MITIDDLKKSKKMLVSKAKKAPKCEKEIVFISSDGAMDVSGELYTHYEEIKEDSYRSYTVDDDLSELLGAKIKGQGCPDFKLILSEYSPTIEKFICNQHEISLDQLFEEFIHLDGTPIGVKL